MAYEKPNTSIKFTQIPKILIPDININNLEKQTKMFNGNQRKTTNEKLDKRYRYRIVFSLNFKKINCIECNALPSILLYCSALHRRKYN